MNKRTKKLLTKWLMPSYVGCLAISSFALPSSVVAASSEPVTLTYTKKSNKEGIIKIQLNSGTSSVTLPNGTTVKSDTNFTVNQNGAYDFVAYDSKNNPTQTRITVSGLDVSDAPLITSNGLWVKMEVEGTDTLSGIKSYRYKIRGVDSWSAWLPMPQGGKEEIKIPTIAAGTSSYAKQVVDVETQDVAGNIATTTAAVMVDHAFPEVLDTNETIYTNSDRIQLPLAVKSYFKNPEKLVVKEGTKTTSFELSDLKHAEIIQQNEPKLILADWSKSLTYTIQPTEGKKSLTLTASKIYEDFKGNVVELASSSESVQIINVVYDTGLPTGSIQIKNEDGVVDSSEVELNLEYADSLSGVDSVKVYQGEKEYTLTKDQIKAGKITLPWKLGMVEGEQKVYMEVTDRAGNSITTESNAVTISSLTIKGFSLTNVVNPKLYPNGFGEEKFYPFNSMPSMIAGSNFSFKVYYNLGYADPSRFDMSGTYQLTMVDTNNKTLYTSEKRSFHDSFDENNHIGYAGFSETIMIPKKDQSGKSFPEGTKVFMATSVVRTDDTGKKRTTSWEPEGTIGYQIGVIQSFGNKTTIDEMVRFQEAN